MRPLIQALLACAAVAAACASQGSDSTDRFSLLEARLERLEARTTPDASFVPAADAGDVGIVAYSPDAHDVFGRPYDAGYPDPDAQAADIASCKAEVSNRCAEELLQARLNRERKTGTKPRWVQHGPPVAADSTPEGRACIQKKRKECDQRFQRDKAMTWLDTQLEPGKRDDKFTNEMRAKIGAKLGVAPDSVNVVCAPQFCRFGSNASHDPAVSSSFGDDFSRGMSDSQYEYWFRRGFELAQ